MKKLFILFFLLALNVGAANLNNSDGTIQKAYRIGNVTLKDTTEQGADAVELDLQNLGQVSQAQVDSRFNSVWSQLNQKLFAYTAIYWLGNRDEATMNISEELNTKVNASELVGQVVAFAGQTAPTNWLECNGAAVSRTTYAALYSAIGTTYGAGDGSTTFNVPDLRGEFVRGWSNGRAGVDTGRVRGSWQAQQIESHQHTINTGGVISAGAGASPTQVNVSGGAAWFANIGEKVAAYGGAETRPRNVAMKYIIRH